MSLFAGKNLVGTPHRVPNRHNDRLEFTPIGVSRSKSNIHRNGDTNSPPKPSTLAPLRVLNERKIDQSFNESSFDNTLDNFNTTINSFQKPPVSSKATTTSIPHRLYPEHNKILNNGMNSIKEQQSENHKLETENYNLKIKLATLNRFFDQTPEEQRELLSQNIDLKQQLMESAREIKQLKESITELQYSSNKENASYFGDKVEDMKLEYQRLLSEKEKNISDYERQFKMLQDELASKSQNSQVSDELIGKLEDLQSDNQSLRRQIDSLNNNIEQLEYENGSVGNNFENTNNELAKKNMQIQELQDEASNWKDKYEYLNSEYKTSVNSTDSLRQSKQEIMHLNSKIKDLEYKYMNSKNLLQQKENDLVNLMGEAHNDQSISEKLNRRIELLSKDIQEKDKIEYDLRSQIRELVDRRHSDMEDDNKIRASEMESLRKRESKLTEQNQKLKIEVSELQDQLYEINTNSNNHDQRFNKLQKQKRELEDKLSYYEGEYEILEKAFNNIELESDSLKSQQIRADEKIIQLQNENQSLLKQLKNSSSKSNNSALVELENFNRRQAESDKQQLTEEVDNLKFELKRMTKELEFMKNDKLHGVNNQFLDSEYQRILMEKNQLQLIIDENSIRFKELESKCKKLQTVIDDKESLVENLESKVREADRNNKLKFLVEDEEKTELLRAKSNNESKMRLLQLENENLQREFETQINFYKNKLEILLQRQEEDMYNKNKEKNFESQSSSIVTLLERQLEDSQRLRNEISQKLTDQISTNDDLKWKLEKSQRDNNQLVDLSSAFEKNEKFVKLENGQLEMKIKKLTEELNSTTRHCSKLANKVKEIRQRESINEKLRYNDNNERNKGQLRGKYQELQSNNLYLQKKLEDLNSKFSSTHMSSPPFESNKMKLLENELHYYRAKLYDINLKSNDLEVMYSFVMNAIKNSNKLIQNDIIKLTQCGIYPDYASMSLQKLQKGDRLSFKTVAKFVLAMVRLRKRTEKSEKRKIRLFELKHEIENDKITLLV